jgi:hypothetical protein
MFSLQWLWRLSSSEMCNAPPWRERQQTTGCHTPQDSNLQPISEMSTGIHLQGLRRQVFLPRQELCSFRTEGRRSPPINSMSKHHIMMYRDQETFLTFTDHALHYCKTARGWSRWPNITLLQHCMRVIQMAKYCITATLHVGGPDGQILHYCNPARGWSIWPNITLLQHCIWTTQLAGCRITVTVHLHDPAGQVLHFFKTSTNTSQLEFAC